MARKTKEEAAVTRERMLTAALDLFTEKGYSRTTLVDIAKRIGMTRGAVYWHFDGKPALLAALMDHVHFLKEDWVESQIPDIQTLEDLRSAFILYARVVESDPVIRKFEFFLNYQMEWSEELLAETQKKLNELRKSPLENFRDYFEAPAIAVRLRPGVDLNQLVITLASFWCGACKMFLGRHCPGIEFGQRSDEDIQLLGGINLEQTIANGFDLIMCGVLKEESGDE
ncbi:MAG: TetR family transcriptional regulator [Kiritimatiellales bacterium]|nr:TetR family transcriptional regulator [Kiritimatiellota bacterium]MBL7011689.1 TetR family transcriptional regulator [Kiritimatiellales bacterium]